MIGFQHLVPKKIYFVMAKLPLVFAFFLFFIFGKIAAQTSPFASPGLGIGAYHFNVFDGTWSTTYLFRGDTILCSVPLLAYETPDGYAIYLRTEGGKVFVRYNAAPCDDAGLLYDFDLQTGQTFNSVFHPPLKVMETGQLTLLNGQNRRYLKMQDPAAAVVYEWVEGIGDLGAGLFRAYGDFEGYDEFVCARDASGDLWFGSTATGILCDSLLCPLPKPGFTTTAQNDQSVDFYNLSRDAATWFWEFGDGATSTALHPQHTYAQPGCYDVCITAYSDCLAQPRRFCQAVSVGSVRGWKVLPSPQPAGGALLGVSFPHPDTGWVIASRHIWKTTDGGQSWTEQAFAPDPPGLGRTLLSIRMLNTQIGIIGAGNYDYGGAPGPTESGILVTLDGGQTWMDRNLGDHTFFQDVALRADGRGYASAGYGVIKITEDFGANWATKSTYPWLSLNNLLYWQGDTLVANGHLGLAPNHDFAIARSFDNGGSWQVSILPDQTNHGRRSVFRSAFEGWLPGQTGTLLHTADAGAGWTAYDFQENRTAADIDFADPLNGWAVGSQGLILHTDDGGLHWRRENCGYDENFLAVAAPAPDVAYATASQNRVLKYCGNACGGSVIKTRATPPASAAALRIFPNPASDAVQIAAPQTGTLRFVNALGQTGLQTTVAAGVSEIPCNALAPGLWAVRLTAPGGVIYNGKLLISR